MRQVIDLARWLGWRCWHNTIAYRSGAGWPDLFMVRGNRAVAAELKTMKGTVSPAQQGWLDALTLTGIETHVFRPSDWPEVERILA